MQRLVAVCLSIGLGSLIGYAGPTETAIVATMRLSEQPNYSWAATITDDARTYDITGQTVRGSFTRVRMPVISSVRRQLGRSVTDTDVDMIFRGNVACVIETDAGWKTPAELRLLSPNDSAVPHASGRGGAMSAKPASSPGGVRPRTVIRSKSSANPDGERPGYSNIQLAISHPHEELGIIVGSHREFRVEGDVVTGVMTDLGAQLLLVRDGQEKITPTQAAGTFKLWLRDGIVVRYVLQLEGVLGLVVSGVPRQIVVNQKATTVLTQVGTTVFDVPLEAQAKLGL